MRIIQNNARATAEPRAQPGRSDEDQHRHLGLDAKIIEREPGRIACRQAASAGGAQPDEPRVRIQAAAKFPQRRRAKLRLEV